MTPYPRFREMRRRARPDGGNYYLGLFEDASGPWEAWVAELDFTADGSSDAKVGGTSTGGAGVKTPQQRAQEREQNRNTAALVFGGLAFLVAVMALD